MRLNKKRLGVSAIEYMMLIVIIIGGLVWMQQYLQRAFQGRWKVAGDTFASGRQYAPGTIDCSYMQINADYGLWYDDNCYQQRAAICKPADTSCENGARITCQQQYCVNQ